MPKHLTLHLRNLFLNQDANYLVQVRPDGSIQENIPSEAVWKNMATGIPGVHYRIEETLSNEIFSQYGLTGWPSYLIIDKNGHLIYKKTAFREDEMVETILRAIDEDVKK